MSYFASSGVMLPVNFLPFFVKISTSISSLIAPSCLYSKSGLSSSLDLGCLIVELLTLELFHGLSPPVAWLYSSSESVTLTLDLASLPENTLLTALSIAAMPSVAAAADDVDCLVFSDSIGLFGPRFFDISVFPLS